MDRREMLGLLGVGAAGLGAFSARPAMAQDVQGHHHHDKATDECMKACEVCAEICTANFNHCFNLVAEGQKDHARSARLSLDCAEFCAMAVTMMARRSELMDAACTSCAEACKRCGAECAKYDSEMMKQCAEACKKCEQACLAMVQSMRGRAPAATR
jgi:hypothetical protein